MAAKKKKDTGPRPFERVWALVLRVPRGKVVTYGWISQQIEKRLTPIGVVWAMRAAPSDALPWHRVVGANGRIATERELPGLQRKLLEREGVAFDRDGNVDLARFAWTGPRRTKRRRSTSR